MRRILAAAAFVAILFCFINSIPSSFASPAGIVRIERNNCPSNGECSGPLGTCQSCDCRDGREEYRNEPHRCGSCEVCDNGNCRIDTTLCPCRVCVQSSDTGRFNCKFDSSDDKRNNNGNDVCVVT